MSNSLKAQLKKVKQLEGRINPDRAWVQETKASLLNTIATTSAPVAVKEHTRRTHTAIFDAVQALFPKQLLFQAKPFFVSFLVFGLAASGWIASASASESLPGDTLWQIKLATEKTQIVLASITGNDKKNVTLQLKFATRRAEEIKTVAAEEKFPPEEKTKRTSEGLKQLQENIASIDTVVQSDAQKDDTGANAKQVNDSTAQISETLKEVATSVEGVDPTTALAQQVVATQQAVDEVGITAVKVAVEGAKNDAERIAAQDLVEQKIVSVLSDADVALHETAEVKALVQQVDVTAAGGVTTSVSSTLVDPVGTSPSTTPLVTTSAFVPGSTSTPSFTITSTPALTPQQTIDGILSQVDKTSADVQTQVDEIKALIASNDLLGALDKATQLKKTTAASTQQTIEIKKTVEQVTSASKASSDTTSATRPASTTPTSTGT